MGVKDVDYEKEIKSVMDEYDIKFEIATFSKEKDDKKD